MKDTMIKVPADKTDECANIESKFDEIMTAMQPYKSSPAYIAACSNLEVSFMRYKLLLCSPSKK